MDTVNFYQNLKVHSMPLRDLLNDKSSFTPLPDDWHIIVVDIVTPSGILEKGLLSDINLVAAGSIITILNAVKSIDTNLQIPYFFKGDGATFLVPKTILIEVSTALTNYQSHVLKTLNIVLKTRFADVHHVYKSGYSIKVAKLKLNNFFMIPVIYGNGLKFAEQYIESNEDELDEKIELPLSIDLKGMECRWDEIFPKGDEKKIICLMVLCRDEINQVGVYTTIMDEINYLFGDFENRKPITNGKLKLDNSIRKMRKEMYVRLGKFDRTYLIQNWIITYIGKYYFKFFKGGKAYLHRVTQLSDTIIIDGSINTVFAGNERQLSKLKVLLDTLEEEGKIIYGLHTTYASIMSCYIEDREENHIHFVDGTEGGYYNAARLLNTKMKGSGDFFNVLHHRQK